MTEKKKTIRLKDDELIKVSGGTYTSDECKPSGLSFTIDSSKNYIFKIREQIGFVDEQVGNSYSVDYYHCGIYIGIFASEYTDL